MTDNTPPELALEIATRHNLLWRDVCGPGSTSEIMACRRDIARALKARRYSTRAIAKMLNKSRGAIVYYLKDQADSTTAIIRSVRELIQELESVQDWSGTKVGAAIDAVEKLLEKNQ